MVEPTGLGRVEGVVTTEMRTISERGRWGPGIQEGRVAGEHVELGGNGGSAKATGNGAQHEGTLEPGRRRRPGIGASR